MLTWWFRKAPAQLPCTAQQQHALEQHAHSPRASACARVATAPPRPRPAAPAPAPVPPGMCCKRREGQRGVILRTTRWQGLGHMCGFGGVSALNTSQPWAASAAGCWRAGSALCRHSTAGHCRATKRAEQLTVRWRRAGRRNRALHKRRHGTHQPQVSLSAYQLCTCRWQAKTPGPRTWHTHMPQAVAWASNQQNAILQAYHEAHSPQYHGSSELPAPKSYFAGVVLNVSGAGTCSTRVPSAADTVHGCRASGSANEKGTNSTQAEPSMAG